MVAQPAANDSVTIDPAGKLRGTIAVPGDKSITHRALMFNALAKGRARIDGFLDSEDTQATAAALRSMGVEIERPEPGVITVLGRGRDALTEPDDVIDCGNSGTTMRLFTGVLAGLPMLTVLSGDASLRTRPMGRVVRPLAALGADVTARADGTLPPIVIRGGPLTGGVRVETGVASGQVKAALLLASLAADGPITVVEPAPTRDHTERMLAAMGATVRSEGPAITIEPPDGDLTAVDVTVPGDISAAAAWMVMASIHPDAELTLTGVGVNPSRSGLIDVLREMGADLELLEERVTGGEPVADIVVRSSKLNGIEIGGSLIPRMIDELPLAALAGAFASGETVIRDAEELRVKESDRVATTGAVLRAFGVDLEDRADGFIVSGSASRDRLRAARVDSAGDHRLAMLAGVAGLLADGSSTIDGAAAVAVSYPEFWQELSHLVPPQ
ncbi:MAG TPA: 3-phosphoshikimate 1-carboxyvinyltransferase [Dehalococcoidia bacterium]|nr:3-phosphoshikimate 1-carboxyvinyltransferase [Dehalococcoidia bacterium]